jgi:hypothetical protein
VGEVCFRKRSRTHSPSLMQSLSSLSSRSHLHFLYTPKEFTLLKLLLHTAVHGHRRGTKDAYSVALDTCGFDHRVRGRNGVSVKWFWYIHQTRFEADQERNENSIMGWGLNKKDGWKALLTLRSIIITYRRRQTKGNTEKARQKEGNSMGHSHFWQAKSQSRYFRPVQT